MKRLQTYEAPGITVTFDPNVCIHSAVCLRTLPSVFDVRRRRWVAAEAAAVSEVAAAIDACPSGALRYVLEGREAAAPAPEESRVDATITASRNGPLLVDGAFEPLDEDGARIAAAGRVALCRCGGAANQPFCDGSHRRVGFESKRRAEPGPA
ncbi:MAG: (4Fe-4S)-binding protein [Thermoanaerobaculia bacterium]|nr:(4Fe-4S)-binding protein [Thermoanaerobaculia bacterium]